MTIPYWCGDSPIRGCILRNIFNSKGFRVQIPLSYPKHNTGRVPRKGSTYPLEYVAKYLSDNGCKEILLIDKKYCVSGRGDIDFAALIDNDRAIVAEVKTRLIPKFIHRKNVLRLMLQYHLDAPLQAQRAWDTLLEMNIVKPKPCQNQKIINRRWDYDNPASISELIRSIIGYFLMYGKRNNVKEIIPVVASMFYAFDSLGYIKSFMERSMQFLRCCVKDFHIGDYAIILVSIDMETEDLSSPPSEVQLLCFGDGCKDIGLKRIEVFANVFSNCPNYRSCASCIYVKRCINIYRKFVKGFYSKQL